MQSNKAASLASNSTQIPNLNSVNHVPRPNWPGSPSKNNQKPTPQNIDSAIHWDLWGPAVVKSLSGNLYVVARIDDASRETALYFQVKKSQTIDSYKCNEALIETQTGN